jgi:hypothetical protein
VTHYNLSLTGNLSVGDKVGIGTASPKYPLEVLTSTTNPEGIISLFNTSLDDYTAFQVQNSIAAWQFSVRKSTDSNNPGGFNFYYSPDGATGWNSVMALKTNGNVGINTTAPSSILDIEGNDANIEIRDSRASGNSSLTFIEYTGDTGVRLQYDGARNGLFVKDNSTDVDLMAILRNSNVGINTTTPNWKLEVKETANALTGTNVDVSNLGFVIAKEEDINDEGVGLGFQSSQGHPNSIGAAIIHERVGTSSQGGLHFATKDSTGEGDDIPIRMTIDKDGKVGINTTVPNSTLDVVGNIYASGNFKFNDTNQSILIGTSTGDTLNYVTALGYEAGYQNTGSPVTVLGYQAGYQNTGSTNTIVGSQAGYQNTGHNNILLGDQAGQYNTGGTNTLVGLSAGWNNSGDKLVALGYQAGLNNTANDVVAIGYQAGLNNTVANQFILKQANINAVPLIQGNFSSGYVGIGTASPLMKLDVRDSAGTSTLGLYKDADEWLTLAPGTSRSIVYPNSSSFRIGKCGDDTYPCSSTTTILGVDGAGNVSLGATSTLFVGGDYGAAQFQSNVGIGTSTPTSKLHVEGNVNVSYNNITQADCIIFKTGGKICTA